METKICTSLEQSKKLIELGIDVNTADMHYATWTILNGEFIVSPNQGSTIEDLQEDYGNQIIPAWSLSALLELMPKNKSLTIDLCLGGSNGIDHTFDWFCTCDENNEPYNYKTFHTSSPIDCTFEMICWLKENNGL